jgi:PleD family two-component response regulator
VTTQRRKRTRAGTTDIADDQLVEVAELGPPPRATVVLHDATAEEVHRAKSTVESLGHTLVGAGAGPSAFKRLLEILRQEEPPAVLVAGLPGSETLVDAALALSPRRPVVIGVVGGPSSTAPYRAHAAGADLVAMRPLDLEHLGPALMAGAALAAERARSLQLEGSISILRARLERSETQVTGLHSIERFKRVLEIELKRARRFGYALSVCNLALIPLTPPPPAPALADLRGKAIASIRDAIRDIDFPVEIADDRFLVLLPYTDTEGATEVARRILAGARESRVKAAGRTWLPLLAAGVAGIRPGGPISMANLMRDAGEALKDALRRSVELVVAS